MTSVDNLAPELTVLNLFSPGSTARKICRTRFVLLRSMRTRNMVRLRSISGQVTLKLRVTSEPVSYFANINRRKVHPAKYVLERSIRRSPWLHNQSFMPNERSGRYTVLLAVSGDHDELAR